MVQKDDYAHLKARILKAHRVWKRKLFLTGCAIVLVGTIAMLAGEAIVDVLMPLPGGVRIGLLVGLVGGMGYLLYRYLHKPLHAKPTLGDVALNVERKHPELEDRLVSALQFGEHQTDDPVEAHLRDRLVADAARHTEGIDFLATIDKRRTRKHIGRALVAVALCVLLALLFPAEIHTTLSRLLTPWEKTKPVLSTKLTVHPGNVRLLRGGSVAVNVQVNGKSADKVKLIYGSLATPTTTADSTHKPHPADDVEPREASSRSIDMVQLDPKQQRFGYEIFNINQDIEYYVVANETESERYTVEVFDIPKITAVEVAYTYPEYTQLSSVVQQGTGDIRAVVGSRAAIRFTANKAIESAMLTVKGQPPIAMEIMDGNILGTTLDVKWDGEYIVELLCADGFNNQTPIEYTITAIPDKPPETAIKQPGRDIKATKLEEVAVVAEATDDYGVEKVAVKYSIGSGESQELEMETASVEPSSASLEDRLRRVSGTYTFYLEELDIEPGDVIYYYAQATDNNTITGPSISTSEIYLIEIRPFNERYEQVDQEREMQTDSPESQAGQMLAQLAADQKQIIKETWRHIHRPPSKLTEAAKTAVKQTGEKQDAFRNKVQQTVDEISGLMRTAAVDPQVLMDLETAIEKMAHASDHLYEINPQAALPFEQDAHALLLKVAIELPKVLTQMRQNKNQQVAEDIDMALEDLQNELEQDQNELDQQMQEQTQEMLDQAQEMLEQQRQLTQRSRQMGREHQPSQSQMQQSSQQQQRLAQQTGEMAQQAQQMAGQQVGTRNGQRMGQAREALQRASEQMRASAENLQNQAPQMSAAKGQKAEENLQQAIENLQRAQAQATDEAVQRATEQLDRLTAEQSEVRDRTEELDSRTQQNDIQPKDMRQASQLANQQRHLRTDLHQLQRELENLEAALRGENADVRRNIADANRRLVEEQVPEDMARAQRALQWRDFQSAEEQQRQVLDALSQARDDLQQARANLAETEEEQLEAALEQTQRLENQVQDIEQDAEAMKNRQTPLNSENEQEIQELAQRQEQIQQRTQQAMEAQQRRAPGENQQAQAGNIESQREIKKLWLNVIDSMNASRGERKAPVPNYDRVLRNLNALQSALENRLVEIGEKKRLAQLEKADVPPEYRGLVERYYESLAK